MSLMWRLPILARLLSIFALTLAMCAWAQGADRASTAAKRARQASLTLSTQDLVCELCA